MIHRSEQQVWKSVQNFYRQMWVFYEGLLVGSLRH